MKRKDYSVDKGQKYTTEFAGRTFEAEGHTFTVIATSEDFVKCSFDGKQDIFSRSLIAEKYLPEIAKVEKPAEKENTGYVIARIKKSLLGYAAEDNFSFITDFVKDMEESGDLNDFGFKVAQTSARYHRLSEKQAYCIARSMVENGYRVYGL